jgi:hypothetical protein
MLYIPLFLWSWGYLTPDKVWWKLHIHPRSEWARTSDSDVMRRRSMNMIAYALHHPKFIDIHSLAQLPHPIRYPRPTAERHTLVGIRSGIHRSPHQYHPSRSHLCRTVHLRTERNMQRDSLPQDPSSSPAHEATV